MIKLIDLLKEGISYKTPNFEFEWGEAQRYPEFKKMKKDGWVKLAKAGEKIKYSAIEDRLGNVDLDFESLDQNKKARFETAYEAGQIEMPIVVKFSEENYDLVAGNTRLSGLVSKGVDPTVWVVDLTRSKK